MMQFHQLHQLLEQKNPLPQAMCSFLQLRDYISKLWQEPTGAAQCQQKICSCFQSLCSGQFRLKKGFLRLGGSAANRQTISIRKAPP